MAEAGQTVIIVPTEHKHSIGVEQEKVYDCHTKCVYIIHSHSD